MSPSGYGRGGSHRTVATDRFAMVPDASVPRSRFVQEYVHKTTFDAGAMIPIYVEEILPGDSLSCRMDAFCRIATPLVPFMDNLYLESFFFFVPCRLVWSNFERFMGEQLTPADVTEFLIPQVVPLTADTAIESTYDYMGITLNNNAGQQISVNALPFRAINLIWNDWFRDQDLENPLTVLTDDGPDPVATYAVSGLPPRAKRRDYFTSARPWPEKPAGQMGLFPGVLSQTTRQFGATGSGQQPGGGFSNVLPGTGALNQPYYGVGVPVVGLGVATTNAPTAGAQTVNMPGGRQVVFADHYDSNLETIFFKGRNVENSPDVRVLINDLRLGMAVQTMLEKNARGGTRYAEIVRSHFRVTSPDARLQRPEFLGGGRSFVNVSPVAQTSATGLTGGTTRLGELSAVGTAVVSGHSFSGSFTEHGYIIGLISIRADQTYQNGVHRMWFRRTPYDFYWPGLAHLGEQAIFRKEIFAAGTAADLDVFGYQERWAEYRSKYSRISGGFRSNQAGAPLDMWHLAQNYAVGAPPVLNQAFIVETPPISRVMQVAALNGQQFLLDALFKQTFVRAMPMFSIPGVGDRF